MKASVSSYSFSRLGLSCEAVIAAAAEIGFDAVEFTDIPASGHDDEIKIATALRLEAEKHGIVISGYSVGADIMAEGGRDVSAEVERIMRKIDVAEALGTTLLRHDATFRFPPKGLSFEDVVGGMADAAREITEYAAKKGIRTATENHGMFCQKSDRMLALVKAVDHPNYGIQLDIGNFLCVDETPLDAVSACAPYAFNLHAKDDFEMDETARVVTVRRPRAVLAARFLSPGKLSFSQTRAFDVPVDAGSNLPDQAHFRATLEPSAQAEILTLLEVSRPGEKAKDVAASRIETPRGTQVRVSFGGKSYEVLFPRDIAETVSIARN